MHQTINNKVNIMVLEICTLAISSRVIVVFLSPSGKVTWNKPLLILTPKLFKFSTHNNSLISFDANLLDASYL
jgi:hypothetical protein